MEETEIKKPQDTNLGLKILLGVILTVLSIIILIESFVIIYNSMTHGALEGALGAILYFIFFFGGYAVAMFFYIGGCVTAIGRISKEYTNKKALREGICRLLGAWSAALFVAIASELYARIAAVVCKAIWMSTKWENLYAPTNIFLIPLLLYFAATACTGIEKEFRETHLRELERKQQTGVKRFIITLICFYLTLCFVPRFGISLTPAVVYFPKFIRPIEYIDYISDVEWDAEEDGYYIGEYGNPCDVTVRKYDEYGEYDEYDEYEEYEEYEESIMPVKSIYPQGITIKLDKNGKGTFKDASGSRRIKWRCKDGSLTIENNFDVFLSARDNSDVTFIRFGTFRENGDLELLERVFEKGEDGKPVETEVRFTLLVPLSDNADG